MITQRRHALGTFEINLRNVPASILQRLTFDKTNPRHLLWSTFVVTPTRQDPIALGNAATSTAFHPLFDQAIYTGVLNDLGGQHNRLSGYGIAWHLGNHEDGGTVFPGNALAAASNNARWVELDTADWFDWLVNGGLQASEGGAGPNITLNPTRLFGVDIGSAAPSLDPVPYFPDFLTHREILTRICNYVGWIWYVTPRMVVTAGRKVDLFPNPRAVIAAGLESDQSWWTIATSPDGIDWDESGDGYANKVASFDSATTPYATTFAYPNSGAGTLSTDIYGPDGNPVVNIARDDPTNQENVLAWGARVQETQPQRENLRRQITIGGSVHGHGQRLIPGEPVWVYEPKVGLTDSANEVHIGGRTIHPVSVDLHTVNWPITKGMGVYVVFYDQTAASLDVLDLTDVAVFENGQPTTLEVGAPSVPL